MFVLLVALMPVKKPWGVWVKLTSSKLSWPESEGKWCENKVYAADIMYFNAEICTIFHIHIVYNIPCISCSCVFFFNQYVVHYSSGLETGVDEYDITHQWNSEKVALLPDWNCFSLTHWGRMTHICVSNLTIIGPDNGLSPGRRQAFIWTNARILLIGPWGRNFSEILIGIHTFSFKKIHLKISAKWRPFCLGLKVLTLNHWHHLVIDYIICKTIPFIQFQALSLNFLIFAPYTFVTDQNSIKLLNLETDVCSNGF